MDSVARRSWRRFRGWRRSRPFWGGLIALISAGELLLPDLAPVKVFLIQGVGAVATGVIVVLVVAMVALTWMNPALRQVTGIIVVVLALASFPLSNLGGFGAGAVLMLVGGSMMVAWVPKRVRRKKRRSPESTAVGVALVALVLVAGVLAGPARARAEPSPGSSPSPSPSPSQSPSGSASASPSAPAGTPSSPSASVSASASPSPSATAKPPATPAALVDTAVSARPGVVNADTITVVNMVYRGVAVLHTATGAAVRALWIQADSVDLRPFHQRSDLVPGRSVDTDNPTGAAELTGHVTLYITELTGRLYGVAPVDYTPDNPPPVPYLPLLTVTQATSVDALIACDRLRMPSLWQHLSSS